MRIGIDLSFIRPDHKNGGTEAAIKNLIKGFEELKALGEIEDEFLYFIHRDIYRDYHKIFPKLSYFIYDIKGPHSLRTIRFQTFQLPGLVKEEKLDLLYFPTFQTGLHTRWSLPLVVNPNDIQYKYYPEYFSFLKCCYFQVFYGNESFIIELKLWKGTAYEKKGYDQLADCLDANGMKRGYLISFCRNPPPKNGPAFIVLPPRA